MSTAGTLELSLPVGVRPLEQAVENKWDEFVKQHPLGSPFHLSAWKRSIAETFGYRPLYLVAMEGERVRGGVPLFLIRNPLIGKALISTPFAVYGGALADNAAVYAALRDSVEALGKSLNVDYVDLRNAHPEQCLGFARVSRYVTFTQEIGPDEEAILASIPRKVRYMVRKALKEPFTTRRQSRDFAAFEDLYSQNLRRLGTPAFPRRHFANLLKHFGDSADIREVLLNDKVVSAVFCLYFRDQVLPYYGASDPAFNASAPNNYMYFDLMRWGGQNGYRTFDFGRSKKAGSGSYDFKAHWGMMERELPYEMLLVRRKALPDYSPRNRAFSLPIKIWQRLPLPVTRMLGPLVLRWVP